MNAGCVTVVQFNEETWVGQRTLNDQMIDTSRVKANCFRDASGRVYSCVHNRTKGMC